MFCHVIKPFELFVSLPSQFAEKSARTIDLSDAWQNRLSSHGDEKFFCGLKEYVYKKRQKTEVGDIEYKKLTNKIKKIDERQNKKFMRNKDFMEDMEEL